MLRDPAAFVSQIHNYDHNELLGEQAYQKIKKMFDDGNMTKDKAMATKVSRSCGGLTVWVNARLEHVNLVKLHESERQFAETQRLIEEQEAALTQEEPAEEDQPKMIEEPEPVEEVEEVEPTLQVDENLIANHLALKEKMRRNRDCIKSADIQHLKSLIKPCIGIHEVISAVIFILNQSEKKIGKSPVKSPQRPVTSQSKSAKKDSKPEIIDWKECKSMLGREFLNKILNYDDNKILDEEACKALDRILGVHTDIDIMMKKSVCNSVFLQWVLDIKELSLFERNNPILETFKPINLAPSEPVEQAQPVEYELVGEEQIKDMMTKCNERIKSITRNDIAGLKALKAPPLGIKIVLKAVYCILEEGLDQDDQGMWAKCQKMIADPKFIIRLVTHDEILGFDCCKTLEKITTGWTKEKVKGASLVCEKLLLWAMNKLY